MNPLRTRSRKIAIGVGSTLAVGMLAFAAVSVGTDIGGSTSVAESSASLSVDSVSSSAASGGLVCTTRTDDHRNIVVDAKAKVVNGVVNAQRCTVTAIVRNNGVDKVRLERVELPAQTALRGWTPTPQAADPVIAAGGTQTYSVEVSTGGSADRDQRAEIGTGSFTGRLVGTTVD